MQRIPGKKVWDIHKPHPTANCSAQTSLGPAASNLEKEQDVALTPQLPSEASR